MLRRQQEKDEELARLRAQREEESARRALERKLQLQDKVGRCWDMHVPRWGKAYTPSLWQRHHPQAAPPLHHAGGNVCTDQRHQGQLCLPQKDCEPFAPALRCRWRVWRR